MSKTVVRIGQEIDVFSVGGFHRYKVIEIKGDKVKMKSTTNPEMFLTQSKKDLEVGIYS